MNGKEMEKKMNGKEWDDVLQKINALYNNGVNVCKGCVYEHAASCHAERIAICKQQLKQQRTL